MYKKEEAIFKEIRTLIDKMKSTEISVRDIDLKNGFSKVNGLINNLSVVISQMQQKVNFAGHLKDNLVRSNSYLNLLNDMVHSNERALKIANDKLDIFQRMLRFHEETLHDNRSADKMARAYLPKEISDFVNENKEVITFFEDLE